MSAGGVDAIVLAGGLGTRLRPLVSELPKPMAPVSGRPFLELLLEYWISQGVRRFILSIGHLAEKIVSHFGDSWRGADIAYARESQPLGTGGGLLLAAAGAHTEDVLVLNGDTFFGVEFPAFSAFHRANRSDCTLSLFRTHDTQRFLGMSLAEGGAVRSLTGEGEKAEAEALANGGVYLMRSAVLRVLPWRAGDKLSLETDLLPHALRSGWRVYGRECAAPFVDIGVPDDYRRAATVLGVS